MIPSTGDIVRWRAILAAFVRVVGFLIASLALFPLAFWLKEGVRDGDLLDLAYYADHVVLASFLGAVGLTLMLTAPWAAILAFPIPSAPRCPKCRYPVENLREPRCPECGLDLPGECPDPSAPSPRALPDAAWLLRARAITAAALRGLAIAFVLLATGMGMLAAAEVWMWGSPSEIRILLVSFGCVSVVGPGLLWLLAPLLSRLVVRLPKQKPPSRQ